MTIIHLESATASKSSWSILQHPEENIFNIIVLRTYNTSEITHLSADIHTQMLSRLWTHKCEHLIGLGNSCTPLRSRTTWQKTHMMMAKHQQQWMLESATSSAHISISSTLSVGTSMCSPAVLPCSLRISRRPVAAPWRIYDVIHTNREGEAGRDIPLFWILASHVPITYLRSMKGQISAGMIHGSCPLSWQLNAWKGHNRDYARHFRHVHMRKNNFQNSFWLRHPGVRFVENFVWRALC